MEVLELSRMAGVIVDMLRQAGYTDANVQTVAQLMLAHLASEEEHAAHATFAPGPPLN